MSVRTGLVAAAALTAAVAMAAPAAAAPGGAPVASAEQHTTAGKRSAAGHEDLRAAMKAVVAEGVPGVVLEARDRRGAWKAAEGVGDLSTGKARRTDDRHRAGSITKTFVATVMLQLEAERRLSLDDTVDKWLPGLVSGNGNDGTAITLRQVLQHTSGLYDYTTDEEIQRQAFSAEGFLANRDRAWDPKELVRVAMGHEPLFAPGAAWRYSNTNYLLAGLVIEKATGRPYAEEIRRRIIKPLGLNGTFLPGNRTTLPKPSSRAYSKFGGSPTDPTHDVTEMNASIAQAAGEIISTPADLNRFFSALVRGKLLPRKQLAAMKDTVPAGSIGGYGLGLIEYTLSCGKVWGHTGGIHGSNSVALTTPDGSRSLAFNFNGDWAGNPRPLMEAGFCGDS